MAGSRNFATKVWNAARLYLLSLPEGGQPGEDLAGRTLSLADRWILSRLEATAADANRHLEAFRFDQASDAIYSYVWHELCDGYLEMAKPALAGADTETAETARRVLRRCLEGSLVPAARAVPRRHEPRQRGHRTSSARRGNGRRVRTATVARRDHGAREETRRVAAAALITAPSVPVRPGRDRAWPAGPWQDEP